MSYPLSPDVGINQTTEIQLLRWIVVQLGGAPGAGGGGGGIPITPPTVNSLPQNLAASSSLVIPVGAKGWTVSCLTGTLTLATSTTASALPAGFSDSDPNVVGAAITVTTASASTAYVRWNV